LTTIVLAGIWHGVLSNRWVVPELDGPIANLARLPLALGDWEGRVADDAPAIAEIAEAGVECHGEVRRYVHRGTGNVVIMYLACGLRNPTLIHNPDLCYPFQGYKTLSEARRWKYALRQGTAAEFRVATYSKIDAEMPHHLRVFWSWRGNGAWQAPDSPRFTFAPNPRLYKLVLVHQLLRPNEELEKDPTLEFLDMLMPEVEKVAPPLN
jgi:hypothetical protein